MASVEGLCTDEISDSSNRQSTSTQWSAFLRILWHLLPTSAPSPAVTEPLRKRYPLRRLPKRLARSIPSQAAQSLGTRKDFPHKKATSSFDCLGAELADGSLLHFFPGLAEGNGSALLMKEPARKRRRKKGLKQGRKADFRLQRYPNTDEERSPMRMNVLSAIASKAMQFSDDLYYPEGISNTAMNDTRHEGLLQRLTGKNLEVVQLMKKHTRQCIYGSVNIVNDPAQVLQVILLLSRAPVWSPPMTSPR